MKWIRLILFILCVSELIWAISYEAGYNACIEDVLKLQQGFK